METDYVCLGCAIDYLLSTVYSTIDIWNCNDGIASLRIHWSLGPRISLFDKRIIFRRICSYVVEPKPIIILIWFRYLFFFFEAKTNVWCLYSVLLWKLLKKESFISAVNTSVISSTPNKLIFTLGNQPQEQIMFFFRNLHWFLKPNHDWNEVIVQLQLVEENVEICSYSYAFFYNFFSL